MYCPICVGQTAAFNLCFSLFTKDTALKKKKNVNRATLDRGTACLSVTPAYGADQDPKGCSQRSRTNRIENPVLVSLFESGVQSKT